LYSGATPLRASIFMTDKDYLNLAIDLATKSSEMVGCGVVIVLNGEVIGEAFNSQRADNCAVYHAEIKAVMAANKKLNSRKLEGAEVYCSCEPCAMCLTALSYAKVARIVFDKRMVDCFPDDPQSKLDPYEYVKGLNFVPRLERLELTQVVS
jgi:tRNA(Arg) A34 adenosine deaminase TadA